MGVIVIPAWERPGPIAWGDLSFELMNSTSAGLTAYAVPAGTTLRSFSASPSPVAEYNLSLSGWASGPFALIEDGQTLVLHGVIPPGANISNRTTNTVFGPTLVIRYVNTGQPITYLMTFADKWVYV
ncbi:MAG TPA: hypothetical protein VEM77_07370 [Thermoplasmata archaeon]|nr:hypothetical protein [Thermoplasmata archaeon]